MNLICDNCDELWNAYRDDLQAGDECPECGGNLSEDKED